MIHLPRANSIQHSSAASSCGGQAERGPISATGGYEAGGCETALLMYIIEKEHDGSITTAVQQTDVSAHLVLSVFEKKK